MTEVFLCAMHGGKLDGVSPLWGFCNRQPLAKSKGVHREGESEGSLRQSSGPRNTNTIRRNCVDELAKQCEVQRLHGHSSVDGAGIWNEGLLS